jgi:hypothetical protein
MMLTSFVHQRRDWRFQHGVEAAGAGFDMLGERMFTVKYLILIHSNPTTRQLWQTLSADQRSAGLAGYAALREDLAASGELIVSEALADPSLSKRIVARDGETMTTDGPFAEVKEHLAGFFLIECESMERAIQHASRIPEAPYGVVEVRPVMDLKAFEI